MFPSVPTGSDRGERVGHRRVLPLSMFPSVPTGSGRGEEELGTEECCLHPMLPSVPTGSGRGEEELEKIPSRCSLSISLIIAKWLILHENGQLIWGGGGGG